MIIDDLVKKRGPWLSGDEGRGIVVSSRVRLARNIRGEPFPDRADRAQRVRLCATLKDICMNISSLDSRDYYDMGSLDPVDIEVLKERHLVSRDLAERGEGAGLVVADDEHVAVMLNEEDHLRLHSISAGLNLYTVLDRINSVDTELDGLLDFAFSEKLGYLTACPTNVGTGMRASVMMHLSGLRLTGDIGGVIKGLERMGLAVRGLLGEGTEAHGNMFQVSNQITLGSRERDIVRMLAERVEEVVDHEINARARLMEDRRVFVLDKVWRAYGSLSHARLLSSQDTLDLLGDIRLGIELGLVKKLSTRDINEIMLLTQPGHLQKIWGRKLNPEERDQTRAVMVRKKIAGAELMD